MDRQVIKLFALDVLANLDFAVRRGWDHAPHPARRVETGMGEKDRSGVAVLQNRAIVRQAIHAVLVGGGWLIPEQISPELNET